MCESVDWIHLIQDRVRWQVLMNSKEGMLRLHERQGIYWLDGWLLASGEGSDYRDSLFCLFPCVGFVPGTLF